MNQHNVNEFKAKRGIFRRLTFVSPDTRSSWRHVFATVATRYRGEAAMMLMVGVASIVAQFAAFGGVIGAIHLMESGGRASIVGRELDIALTPDVIWIGVGGIALLLTAAAGLTFATGALVARYRRSTFRDLIALLVDSIGDERLRGVFVDASPRELSRMLRRECRYLSRSYVDAMAAPRSLITFLVLMAAGLAIYPGEVALLLGVFAAIAPVHLVITRRGERNTDEMLRAATAKSASDSAVVTEILCSPFFTKDDTVDGEAYSRSPGVDNYLSRYERRMRLGPLSQLASSIALVVSLTLLAAIWARAYLVGELSFARILGLALGFRIAAAAGAQVIQYATIIASYSPLTRTLIEFLDQRAQVEKLGAALPSPIVVRAEQESSRIVAFLSMFPTVAVARRLTALAGERRGQVAIVHAEIKDLPLERAIFQRAGSIRRLLENRWTFLDEERLKEADRLDEAILRGELREELALASIGLKVLIVSALTVSRNYNAPIVAHGPHMAHLTPVERAALFQEIDPQRILIVTYNSAPKRLWLPEGWDVCILGDDRLIRLGDVADWERVKPQVDDRLNAERAAAASGRRPGSSSAGVDDESDIEDF